MADLLVTYSKTPKGLRARSSFLGGMPSKLFKVLSFIDGVSKAQSILTKHNSITPEKLLDALTTLENDGYIKPVVNAMNEEDDWDFDSGPAQFVVEEFSNTKQERLEKLAEQEEEVREKAKIEAELKQAEEAKISAEIAALKLAAKAVVEIKEIEFTPPAPTETPKQTPKQNAAPKPQPAEPTKQKPKNADPDNAKALQQAALIKAIEKAKAETKVQEQMQAEKAAAKNLKAQNNLKLEALAKLKAAQQTVATEQAKLLAQTTQTEKQETAKLAAEKQAALEAEKIKLAAEKVAQHKAEKLRRAAEEKLIAEAAAHAEKAIVAEQINPVTISDAKKEEKAALQAQKIAFAEAEQLRLMAEFEAKNTLANSANDQAANNQAEDTANHATLVAQAKAKLKEKAEARAKLVREQALAKAEKK